jgi:O-antigen/teichoic acid export membrane protein
VSVLIKKLAGQTVAYGLSSILGRALNFLLVPLYTSVLATGAYGIVSELYAYVAFLNIVFTFGMETAYFRFANRPGMDRQRLYDEVQSLLLVSSILFSGLLILFSGQLAEVLDYAQYQHFLIYLSLIVGVDAIVSVPFARLRLEGKAFKFAFIRLLNIVVVVVGNLLFLKIFPEIRQGLYLQGLQPFVALLYNPQIGLGYIFLVNLGANLLFIPLLWKEIGSMRFRLDTERLKPMLRYAYPLMIMGLAGAVNEVIDRILLRHYLPEGLYPGLENEEVVGIYSACYKLAIFMSLAIQAFRYAAEPFFFSQAADKNSPQTFALVMRGFVLTCAFLFVGVSANVEIFATLFLRRPDYWLGLQVVPVLLMANLFLGVYYNLTVWFKLTDRTYYGTYIGLGGAVITIVLNLLLIPVLGFMGSAIATLACYFSMALTCFLLGNRHYPIPYPVAALSGYLALAVGLVVLALAVPIADDVLRFGFRLGVSLLFPLIVFLLEWPNLRRKPNV